MDDIDTLISFIMIVAVVACIVEAAVIFRQRRRLKTGNRIEQMGADSDDHGYEEEIKKMVRKGQERGAIEAGEREMINNIFEFGDKEAKDVMRFRRQIVGVDCRMTLEEALNFMLDAPYSRYPLYDGDIDNILGILYLKDVIDAYLNQNDKTLTQIAREAFFVHETMEIPDLFQKMQKKKIHMAVVVDEYGQTEGIVAMEDMLEVIVGNILDEYDIDEHEIVKLTGNSGYLIQGVTRLEELEDLLGIQFPDQDIETINGFMIDQLNRLPDDTEEVEIIYEGYSFQSVDIHDKMIRQIKVSKTENEKHKGE